MNRRLAIAFGIMGAAIAVAPLAAGQGSGKSLLSAFTTALSGSKSVSGSYTVQRVGAAPETITISLKKPNQARIETGTGIWVADGKTITVYEKADKTYTKYPQNDADLKNLFLDESVNLWSTFFDAGALKPVTSKALGQKSVGGKSMPTVEATFDKAENRVVTYYLDPSDSIARKAVAQYGRKGDDAQTTVIDANAISIDGAIKDDVFAFAAPADSREVTVEERSSSRWYTDLDEAMAVAQKSNRRIFVDFMATWCGPCKRLEADVFGTDRWKALSSKFVFLRIDVDRQPQVSSKYGITAMPTQMILDKNGGVLDTTVGYANATEFFKFMDKQG